MGSMFKSEGTVKFKCLPMSVFWHSMVCSNYGKSCFIVTFNKPIVGELLPSLLPGQRAGKGGCDVTSRDPKP